MKSLRYYPILILTFLALSCSSDHIAPRLDDKFVPTDVIVKTKGYFTIDKVFEFINGFNHDVEYVYNGIYDSSLPPDSLAYVLDFINAKPYSTTAGWRTSGYLNYQTNRITVFPRLFQVKNQAYQQDWLQTVNKLKMTEKTDASGGWIIYFHVPAGQEKIWATKFEKYDFVDWTDLNYIISIDLD